MLKSLKQLKRSYRENSSSISHLHSLTLHIEEKRSQIVEYTQLTEALQDIPGNMISATRKSSFQEELDGIIGQFEQIQKEISEASSRLARSGERLAQLNQKLDKVEQKLVGAVAVYESVTVRCSDGQSDDSAILVDKIASLNDLLG